MTERHRSEYERFLSVAWSQCLRVKTFTDVMTMAFIVTRAYKGPVHLQKVTLLAFDISISVGLY